MKSPKELIEELVGDGLTQEQIGDGTGIKQATISRILSGEIADTKFSNWQSIQRYHSEHFCASSKKKAAA